MISAKDSFKISQSDFRHVSAVKVHLEGDNFAVVAYGDGKIPSVMVAEQKEPKRELKKISFEGFEGYRVWCCEIEDDEMKVCLVR